MRHNQGHQLLLAAVAAVILFTNLGGGTLFDEDEPKNAECAREMLEAGELVVPSFNYELRTDKPVLLYWLMMLAYSVFGVGELGARFWSAAFGVGTVLLTYRLGRTLFRPGVGLWAGLALASSMMFDVVARHATPDSTLIFFVTLTFVLYVRAIDRATSGAWQASRDGGEAELLARYTPRSAMSWCGVYAAMALAVLAKGPVGVVLPVSILGLFLLCLTRPAVGSPWPEGWMARSRWLVIEGLRPFAPRRVLRAGLALRPLVCLAMLCAIALPWYIAVGVQTEGAWLAGFLGKHNVGRFVGPMENHRGPIFYYVIAILIGFFPWSVFFTPSLVTMARRWRSAAAGRPALLFVACWAGFWIGFFSLAGTKLPNYVLPAYPALALVVGFFLDGWIGDPKLVTRRLVEPSLATLAVIGAVMIVALAVLSGLFLPGDWPIALVGIVPLVGGVVSVYYFRRGEAPRAVVAFAVSAVLLSTLAFGWVAPRASRHQNALPLVVAAREGAPGDGALSEPCLATFDYWLPSVVFYAEAPVARLGKPDDVQRLFAEHAEARLLIRPDQFEALRPTLPAEVVVLARQKRFLRRGEVLLIGRPGAAAIASAGETQLR